MAKKKIDKTQEKSLETEVISYRDLPKNLSLEYNVRAPTRHSKAYKAMMETLKTNPEEFVFKNQGITIANGKYILNGGHTWLALEDSRKAGINLEEVRLKVIWEQGLDHKDMLLRSEGLNINITPPLYGIRDAKGDWDMVKNNLPDKYEEFYQFRPGTKPEAPFDVSFLLCLLHGWHPGRSKLEHVYNGKNIIIRLWEEHKYRLIVDKLGEAIEAWSMIAESIASLPKSELDKVGIKSTGKMILPDGRKLDKYIPEAFIWPMYSGIGKLIDEDTGEWKKDWRGIFKKSFKAAWATLLKDFRENKKDASTYGKNSMSYLNMQVTIATR